jgi:hypothetical protein
VASVEEELDEEADQALQVEHWLALRVVQVDRLAEVRQPDVRQAAVKLELKGADFVVAGQALQDAQQVAVRLGRPGAELALQAELGQRLVAQQE